MSKIHTAFENGKAVIAFLTAGDPSLNKTEEFIVKIQEAGADLIEIGIPFSDPIAEGPAIQEADLRALSAGCTIDKVFDMVERVRPNVTVPLVFHTYLNPVFNYGYEAFFAKCEALGIDGVFIPDVPYEEKNEIEPIAKAHNVEIISLIAPASKERLEMIAKASTGFLYASNRFLYVPSCGNTEIDLDNVMITVKNASDTPIAMDFDDGTPEQAKAATKIADGVIIGSALVKLIGQHGDDAAEPVYHYVKTIKDAIR